MRSYLQYRFRRQLRNYSRDLVAIRNWWVSYFNAHIWGKWRQLGFIRRLIMIWWGLMIISLFGLFGQLRGLQSHYLTDGAASGGTYVEGVVGSVKNINPVLPESAASADVARLIFSGLTRYNSIGKLEGDLAESWSISGDNKTYTFKLRRGVKWHDGVNFTAHDVVFTLVAIQNPDSRSPLASSWQGVKANALDDYTVEFELPSPYTPFLYSTTVGILPRHLLESIDPKTLRATAFNQKPVGTGPFKIKHFIPSEREVLLVANPDYHWGRPRLDEFMFRFYNSTRQLINAYARKQVTAVARVDSEDYAAANRLPEIKLLDYDLPQQTNLFFKTTAANLKERNVRLALQYATSRQEVVDQVMHGRALAIGLPILPGQTGYDARYKTPDDNLQQAKLLLDQAGWKLGRDGLRRKDGKVLKLRLATRDGGAYPKIAELLRARWRRAGVDLEVIKVDVTELQQTHIKPRNYDILLYGINIGADPDVYAFWHSSQVNDPGLNLSQYNSKKADTALEQGRIASDGPTRAVKYAGFLQAWVEDVPGMVLFSPYYNYAVAESAKGMQGHPLSEPADRFYRVERWTVRTAPAPVWAQ